MYMNVLLACVSAPCTCLMLLKVRKCHDFWNRTCKQLRVTMWVLRNEPSPLQEQLSLQLYSSF